MKRYYRDANGRFQVEFLPDTDHPRDPQDLAALAAMALWAWLIVGGVAAVIVG